MQKQNSKDDSLSQILGAISEVRSDLGGVKTDLGGKIDNCIDNVESLNRQLGTTMSRVDKIEKTLDYQARNFSKNDVEQKKLINNLERKFNNFVSEMNQKVQQLEGTSTTPGNTRKRLPKFIFGSNSHDQKEELGCKKRIHLVYKLPNTETYNENWIRKNTVFPNELAEIVAVTTLQPVTYTSQIWPKKSVKVTFESDSLTLASMLGEENRKYFPCGVPICRYNFPRRRSKTVNGVSFYVSEENSKPKEQPKTNSLEVPKVQFGRQNSYPKTMLNKPILKQRNSHSENGQRFPAEDARLENRSDITVTITPADDITPNKAINLTQKDFTKPTGGPSQKFLEACRKTAIKSHQAMHQNPNFSESDYDSFAEDDAMDYDRLVEEGNTPDMFKKIPGFE